ncbi:polyphosphoinositide phosphatase isoform X2 [Strongylocentrotus purpuratus]|uniref:SAC domain-containing protein n=1 Tax=Strongylocentrotus purpuratus TaxID=7668 RepID=A0A7M7T326_STRPU|nr:polyphosphoinositide phosphatase isoform X2 [Strongylocentrotus purpuratus]
METDFFISNIQKIVLYETKARFYIIGSNNAETEFRVLKIDRTEARELLLTDDKISYTLPQIKDLLQTLRHGNRGASPAPSSSSNPMAGWSRNVSAFGIAGFVRFLEGYYIILITKRKKVAIIGGHTIYKIEDTSMVHIPHDNFRKQHPDEARYLKMFQNVDLSSNFYFSYSYDLTHSLQHNLSAYQNKGEVGNPRVVPIHTKPKFAWNHYLWNRFQDQVHPCWAIHVIHGFVGQCNICVFGRPVLMTLVARRSAHYAGTRFLKRGANSEGGVANEVETEQIVHEASLSELKRGRFASYVQHRGSVPALWSQDITTMVPKPPINIDMADPFAHLAGRHVNDLFSRFGSPVIVVNLVKKREKRKRESHLTEALSASLSYLNQFLPPKHQVQYIHLDMARYTKNKNADVMSKLEKIASRSVEKTGIFLSGHAIHPSIPVREGARTDIPQEGTCEQVFIRQMGVVRTNCVDCLDRTNTAQFVTGKYALGHQLYSLGVVADPELEFDSDVVRMLEDLYEDMGDTLALQYGGSQLVHSISTYRKIAPWTSHSRDIKQTLSRYYSNAFSDNDKQSAINLFLGVFTPREGRPNLWELPTDYYLHHTDASGTGTDKRCARWCDNSVLESLPLPCEEVQKFVVMETADMDHLPEDCIDTYLDLYRPFQLAFLDENFFFKLIPHSLRHYSSRDSKELSPFTARVTQSKRAEDNSSKASRAARAGTPKSSSEDGSTSCGTSSSSDETSDDSCFDAGLGTASRSSLTMKDMFPSMKEAYGVQIKPPERKDVALYQRFSTVGLNSQQEVMTLHSDISDSRIKRCMKRATRIIPSSGFSLDTSVRVTPPTVDRASRAKYEAHVLCGANGPRPCLAKDLSRYREYFREPRQFTRHK